MRFIDIIQKKREGRALTTDEIQFMIDGYTSGQIPDYQMSAFLMAVYFNSMTTDETVQLTQSMANSGISLNLDQVEGFKADKHSTGGVGDGVSLVLAPLAAACGLKMGKLSGRGLGHTGGTIDKLESIPDFQVKLNHKKFIDNLCAHGVAIMEHTDELVPADEKIYSLRDATATVNSTSLIVSSIMSKKLACSPDGVVLDVKVGSGAFMKTMDKARELAQGCIDIGEAAGLTTSALITNMDFPLGRMVGNALEVKEAIHTLRGDLNGQLKKVTSNLVAELILQSGLESTHQEALNLANERIADGSALDKFEILVRIQGGNAEVTGDLELLPQAEQVEPFQLPKTGYVQEIKALPVGQSANLLGAGREQKGADIDYGAGIELLVQVGDKVEADQPLAKLHYSDSSELAPARTKLQQAFTIGDERPRNSQLIKARLR